jgi:hypothetical protein
MGLRLLPIAITADIRATRLFCQRVPCWHRSGVTAYSQLPTSKGQQNADMTVAAVVVSGQTQLTPAAFVLHLHRLYQGRSKP